MQPEGLKPDEKMMFFKQQNYGLDLLEANIGQTKRIQALRKEKEEAKIKNMDDWNEQRKLRRAAFELLDGFVMGTHDKLWVLNRLENIGFRSDKLKDIKSKILKEDKEKKELEELEREREAALVLEEPSTPVVSN